MTSYKLYEVYCIEEATTRRVTSFTEPTQCPLIHNDRTIDQNQTVIIDQIFLKADNFTALNGHNGRVTTTNYCDLTSSFFFDASRMDTIISIKFTTFFRKKSSNGTYSIRAVDKTHNTIIGSITISNENDMNEMTSFSNFPSNDAVIEFHAMVSKRKDFVIIKDIFVYWKSLN